MVQQIDTSWCRPSSAIVIKGQQALFCRLLLLAGCALLGWLLRCPAPLSCRSCPHPQVTRLELVPLRLRSLPLLDVCFVVTEPQLRIIRLKVQGLLVRILRLQEDRAMRSCAADAMRRRMSWDGNCCALCKSRTAARQNNARGYFTWPSVHQPSVLLGTSRTSDHNSMPRNAAPSLACPFAQPGFSCTARRPSLRASSHRFRAAYAADRLL